MARWDEALALYLAGDFSDARRVFDRLCTEFPDDKPSRVLAERCAMLECEAHPPNWDGVTRLMEKRDI